VWPTAHAASGAVRAWLSDDCGARILHESEVAIPKRGAVATCMALYFGEDWVHTNCWYSESPLPEGPPKGPYAGAKWKAALTFSGSLDAPLTVFVVDTADTGGGLWHRKYGFRESLRRAVGGLGNSCIHLTDDQSTALCAAGGAAQGGSSGGYACDSSYAFHCARVLLDDSSVAFLGAADADLATYAGRFDAYAAWLSKPPVDGESTPAPFF